MRGKEQLLFRFLRTDKCGNARPRCIDFPIAWCADCLMEEITGRALNSHEVKLPVLLHPPQ